VGQFEFKRCRLTCLIDPVVDEIEGSGARSKIVAHEDEGSVAVVKERLGTAELLNNKGQEIDEEVFRLARRKWLACTDQVIHVKVFEYRLGQV